MLETFVNPFAPTPASDSKKKRVSRKRQSFPPPWSAALGAAPLSKYLSDFTELELVGSGSFSKVFRCRKKLDGWIYAVKKSKRHFRGKADTCVRFVCVAVALILSFSSGYWRRTHCRVCVCVDGRIGVTD